MVEYIWILAVSDHPDFALYSEAIIQHAKHCCHVEFALFVQAGVLDADLCNIFILIYRKVYICFLIV